MKLTRRQLLKGAGAVAAAGAGAAYWQLMKLPAPGNNRRIKLLFNFGPHGSKEDFEDIKPLLREFKPHAVCLEEAGGTEQDAQKIEHSYVAGKDNLLDEEAKALHASLRHHGVKRVFILERLPESLDQSLASTEHFGQQGINAFFEGKPMTAIAWYRSAIQISRDMQRTREASIKQTLSNLYSNLVKHFPELEKERELRVVIRYGAAHTPIYRAAKGMNFKEVKRKMRNPVYFYGSAIHDRRAAFGLPDKNSDEEIARTLLTDLLATHSANVGAGYSNSSAFANLLSRKFTLKQFKRISNRCAQAKTEYQGMALYEALTAEGIALPRSREEVEEFLRRRRIPLGAY